MHRLGILIGRFQPFHEGHLLLLRRALENVDKLLVFIGSANLARTVKNPFSFNERQEMISFCLNQDELARIIFLPLDDFPYDDASWVTNLEIMVEKIRYKNNIQDSLIYLIGHEKDESSYYLKLFPNWKYIEVENFYGISATPLRDQYLRLDSDKALNKEFLPLKVYEYLNNFRKSTEYSRLQEERLKIDQEKQAWVNSPYPPIFVTVDALVRHQDKILLIKRKRAPGRGLLAMPGGFVEENETLYVSCLRELREETSLQVNADIWKKFLRKTEVFDKPNRSQRGRIITHVFYFLIPDDCLEPVVSADDDASESFWQDLHNLNSVDFHDDHYHIIRQMLN